MDFDSLIGTKHDFYGASENQFKLGSQIWEAKEDEENGYRSFLDAVELVTSEAIFFNQPIAKVNVIKAPSYVDRYEFEGYQLVDEDSHIWLTFGTQDPSDYYPSFIFNYQPKLAAPRSGE
jgi:hypothetical protein